MLTCRICYEPDNLISVCKCNGTAAGVHFDCIQKWILISRRTQCEICHEVYRYHKLRFVKSLDELRIKKAVIITFLLGMVHGITLWFDSHFELQYLWVFMFACILFNVSLSIICVMFSKFKIRFHKLILFFYGGFLLGEIPGHIITGKINTIVCYCYIFNILYMFFLLCIEYKLNSRREPMH